ncbi:Lipase 1 [Fusarium culmorum]|uniref:Lipase 1 n=1 Tax=Fusarium culmorum TaxID=5516 RepID=A0A2T4GXE2_FUSCU|nr:Lipase 1 [Fusarium culmorum]
MATQAEQQAAANAFIQEVWGLQGAAYFIVGLRYYSQFSSFGRRIQWDDILMLLATIVYTAESVAAYFVVAYWKGLANNGITPAQRQALRDDPDSPEWALRVNGSKTHVIGLLLYMTLLWLLKGYWVIYYLRLTEGVASAKRYARWGTIIIPVTYVSCFLVAFLKCIPFEKQWQIDPEPPNSCLPAITYIQTIYVMAMNTATDFFLMSIPLPMIWKARMPWRKKVVIMFMFSGALLEMIFGILRAVSILTKGNTDPAQSGYWSVRESFVSFVVTNLPMVYPLLKRVVEKTVSASKSGTRTPGLGDSQGYRLGDYKNKANSRSRPDETDLGDTVWGSKDHIVPADGQASGDDTSIQSASKAHRDSHLGIRSQNIAKAIITVSYPVDSDKMVATLKHHSLQTTLTGVEANGVTQFRGIPYGHIPQRFTAAEKINGYPKELNCTTFGPRCPQVPVDVGHLLRVPSHHQFPDEPEDEFSCANLDVVLPSPDILNRPETLPVFVWIHGGSQAVTFGSAASGICDMTAIVADSIRLGTPIIAVSIQYRLNVFALGSKDGPPNLALRDQALALEWIQDHIADFGGDPGKVTLAGESAGAVYCHAHIVTQAPVNQFILSSGSLFLSPPLPPQMVSALRDKVSKQFQGIDATMVLETAPTDKIVEAVKQSGLQSFFLEWEERFNGWETSTGEAGALLLSDAVIWQAGIWATDIDDIVSAFDAAGEHSEELKKLYHIRSDRPSSCKTGALDFINDCRFVFPIHQLELLWKDARKPVYRCLIDESNPWQPSTGAHHAVDLVLLFGGLDLSHAPAAERTGQALREAWIKFVNQTEPWPNASSSFYGFGPHGVCKKLEDWEVQSRRRVTETNKLQGMDPMLLVKAFISLAAGRGSLSN